MKMLLALIAFVVTLPVFAQTIPPRPIPPLPPHNWPNPWPNDPWNDPWRDRCWGNDYDDVRAMTRKNAEAKAESWGATKNVRCEVTKVNVDSATAMCYSQNGAKFAKLTMLMNTTCGPRWGNSSRLRKTKILYY